MTAQRPGISLEKSTLDGLRSFVFFRQKVGYDYLTQLPNGENELIVGGSIGLGGNEMIFKEVANADDSAYDPSIAAYLSGIIPVHYGEKNWGAEKPPAPQKPHENDGVRWNEGRVKSTWSGIICLSADMLPWVGRLPVKLTGRRYPPASSTPTANVSNKAEESTNLISPAPTASPGEWISAGYTGEGMVHAWLCAKALAYMVLGAEEDGRLKEWFPDIMKVTEARWKRANIENLMDELGGSD
jgi:glycine/D-amino acid oxidase-like deaminating enzyme